MIREHLERIPQFALPSSFSIRWYQSGDAQAWVKIQQQADQYHSITPALFEREFGHNDAVLQDRQCFLCDASGQAIGTATAWFNDNYRGKPYGRVHWVALVPAMQGKGLAKPLLSAVCSRLRELNHTRAYLVTETARIPAINLYLKFGFVPEIKSANDLSAWREVERRGLNVPLHDHEP